MLFRVIDKPSNPDAAMEMMRHVLAESGYRVQSTADGISGERSGMMQKGDNPIVGASSIALRSRNRRLELDVEFEGIRRTAKFLNLFSMGLSLTLLLVFGIVFGASGLLSPVGWFILIGVLAYFGSPLFLTRPIVKSYRLRSVRALDTLAHNLAEVSGGTVSVPPGAP